MEGQVFRKQVVQPNEVWLKCKSLYDAGCATGAFRTPRPLAYCERESWIELEWLENLVPLSAVFVQLDEKEKERCLHLAGAALGNLHDFWKNEPGVHVQELMVEGADLMAGLPGLSSCEALMVHGDFGFGNIFCVAGNWKRLVILDPEPAPYLTLPIRAVMSPALDICHFAGCLEGVFSPWRYWSYSWSKTAQFRRQFLVGYGESSGLELSFQEIDVLTSRLLIAFGCWLQKPGHSLSNRLLGRFLNRRARTVLKKGK